MNMQPGRSLPNSLRERKVCLARVARMYSALHADFGRTTRPRLARAPCHLIKRQVVGGTPKVLMTTPFGERAKIAPVVAKIGVVDIARHDIAHNLT